jgi:hypothetical protein
MLATESSGVKKVINLLFVSAVLAIVVAYVFRAELSEAVSDAILDNPAAVKRPWSRDMGGRFSLRPGRNDAALLKVGALRLGQSTSMGVPIAFDLTNLGDANDYPSVGVIMLDANRRALRQVIFSAKDYQHEGRFQTHRVELLLQPRPEERSFTVRAFYGSAQ